MKDRGQGGQIRGPLWISTGEQFSPLGTRDFLLGIKHLVKQKLKNTQFYKKEVSITRSAGCPECLLL
jgi:hypothetical protein